MSTTNNFSQKFFLYARKSTDKADRQVLSIETQLTEVREYAQKEGLTIVKEFIETKSAKQPGREVFEEMLAGIENGEANGILAWHPDRLAQNAVDAGKIILLLDRGFLNWSERRGSNPRPSPWKGDALPAELLSQIVFNCECAEGQSRTDIPGFSDPCRNHLGYLGKLPSVPKLSYYPGTLWAVEDLNL